VRDQALKLERRIMQDELTGYEWVAVWPFLTNKPRGVPPLLLARADELID
jgi:hypothetical protein